MATDPLTRNRRRFAIPATAAVGGALAGLGLLVALGNDGGASADSATSDVSTTVAPLKSTEVGAAAAGRIAAAVVGGTVDSVTAETDYGAAWDVDVDTPKGEYTIYVSSSGAIVRVEGPFTD